MAVINATGVITRTADTGLYTWTWKDDPNQPDVDSSNSGRTLTQAIDDVQAAATQLAANVLAQSGYTAKITFSMTVFTPGG